MSAFRLLAVAALTLALAAPAFARDPSRTRLLAAPDPAKAGETVTLTAEVDGLGGGAPTGKVSFSDGSVALGSGTLSSIGTGHGTLATGYGHICALTSTGGVSCWGANARGQLGDGTSVNRATPVAVSGLSSGVVAITASRFDHTCALTQAGAVECWGDNSKGQLGDGTTIRRHTPVAVSGLSSGVVAIAAGHFHSCALTSGGAVKCWGLDTLGQLGDDGVDYLQSTPRSVVGLSSGVVAITAGGYHSCALTSAGAVKCWGWDTYGQLGDGTSRRLHYTPLAVKGLSSGVVAIAAGHVHTCALTSSGAVKCWGRNNYGQLGDGTRTGRRAPVDVATLSNSVVAIGTGSRHSCAVTSAGDGKCWGSNYDGQLGDGSKTDRLTPDRVSFLHGVTAIGGGVNYTCASTNAGFVRCWGDNRWGQLGNGTYDRGRYTPRNVPGFTALVRARASLSTSALTVGTHVLKASFPFDANHLRSNASRELTVVP
ncbi:chromosome condensation regulator RCC1 [Methylosinus sp. Sm6]|uniref:RCC1 domain-containing protein n=1 Tax=Methylosinus sp. Sm6 TaxID=2866948 RepID=UPI001C9999D3|nr:chromosome condensation regulator RCC1 [Methylosinus sp. Sm6]MBY6242728.1 chromosome condensation regulator RCC1 [Methylosinus sp. Sm6]